MFRVIYSANQFQHQTGTENHFFLVATNFSLLMNMDDNVQINCHLVIDIMTCVKFNNKNNPGPQNSGSKMLG